MIKHSDYALKENVKGVDIAPSFKILFFPLKPFPFGIQHNPTGRGIKRDVYINPTWDLWSGVSIKRPFTKFGP